MSLSSRIVENCRLYGNSYNLYQTTSNVITTNLLQAIEHVVHTDVACQHLGCNNCFLTSFIIQSYSIVHSYLYIKKLFPSVYALQQTLSIWAHAWYISRYIILTWNEYVEAGRYGGLLLSWSHFSPASHKRLTIFHGMRPSIFPS